jgi:hypothetical protein
MNSLKVLASVVAFCLAPVISAQTKPTLDAEDPASKFEDKHVMGVLPNYRTAELTTDYHPISNKYKMTIALKDSFDTPLMVTGAIYASFYQLADSHPQFGQGTLGYLRRFGASYNDQLMGNMMTEGVLPVLFREDPRYFRLAEGPVKKRIFYALSRIFITRTNTGASTFNYAEIIGNSASSAVGLTYYADDREFSDYAQNVGTQLATDALSQVLKEFWPDIKRHYLRKHHTGQ